jgi:hypothetical protein
MTGRLQEELARIADAAPVAEVPADTWARARRARRRDRGLALAASAAVVALVAGLVSWLPTLPDAAVAGSSAPGLPDHLYAVPERMSARGGEDDVWLRDEVTSDVAVGRAAAAWLTPDGLPVVVGATDGRYHLLDLPGFSGNNWVTSIGLHPATIALSPDGRRLAYSWATFGPDAATEPIPSGVRVLDLESGTIREIPLPGAEGTAVEALGWSADSRWLAWGGARLGSWTTGGMGLSEPIAGRIAPGSTTGEEYVPRRVHPFDAAVGVDVRGNVSLFGNGAVNTWDGRNQRVAPLDDVAVTTRQASVDAGGRVALPSPDGDTLFVLDSLGTAVRQSDIGRLDDGASEVHALGWVGDELLLATNGADSAELRLFSVDDERSRVVGTVDGGVAPTLTVAIDLVTADRPTVERPEPDWPWSDERRAVMIGLGVVGVLALLYGARRIGRRRPLR